MISERFVSERNGNGSFVFFLKPSPTDNVFGKKKRRVEQKNAVSKNGPLEAPVFLMNAKDHPKALNRNHGSRI